MRVKIVCRQLVAGAVLGLALPAWALVPFDNLVNAGPPGFNTGVSNGQWPAATVNAGPAAVGVTGITVNVRANNGTVPLTVRLCPDLAGAPSFVGCQTFTTGTAITGALANVAYTGTYAMAANSNHWVVLSTTGAGNYAWGQYTAAAVSWAFSGNQGTSWTGFNNTTNFLFAVAGGPSAATSVASVPTLGRGAVGLLGVALAGIGAVFAARRRAG